MSRMKTFFRYFIIFILFYIVSDIVSYQLIKSTYIARNAEINNNSTSLKIEVTDFKSTITNGYLKGKITNISNEAITDKFLKLDFISPNGVNVGTKYIDFGSLAPGESKDFETRFNFDNVKSANVSTIDKVDLPNIEDLDFTWDDLKLNKTNLGVVLFAVFVFFGTDIVALL